MEIIRTVMSRLGRFGGLVLFAMFVVVAGVWAFVALLEDVNEGETYRFDSAVLNWVATHQGPRWMQEVVRDITALGGLAVLSFVSLAVLGFLILTRRHHATLALVVAVVGGVTISLVLKWVIDRPRPSVMPHGSIVHTASFPSGHSMLSSVVYLTLGTLLARITRERVLRVYFLLLALVLTGAVGVSRVYLGVHWPTDVLAGWSAGLAWATLCWLGATWLQSRGMIESTLALTSEPIGENHLER